MFYLICFFTIAHVFFFLLLAIKWVRIPTYNDLTNESFTIVIPARNEKGNIPYLIKDLENQTISRESFEVIVVDDFSEDGMYEELISIKERSALDLSIIQLKNENQKGKKYALTRGIEEAKYPIILTTDADCRVHKQWVASMAEAFSVDTKVVAGPVALQGDGLFASLQKVEFAGLMAFGGVTLTDNNPSTCSGANFGFRKNAFEKVGGYEKNISIPSGDDEFLLYDIMKKFPGSGRFLKSSSAFVTTQAHQRFKAFFHQRSRWITKWKKNQNWKLRLIAVLIFLDYLALLTGLYSGLVGTISWNYILLLLLMRVVADYSLLKPPARFSHHQKVISPLLTLQIIYPFYILFMGVVSIFGSYTWKGRRY